MIKILNDKRIMISIIALQTLTLFAVYISWQPLTQETQGTEVLAETYIDPDQLYRDCLSRPVDEREACSREIGRMLSSDETLSENTKISNCMKLRPIFFRYCFEELRQTP